MSYVSILTHLLTSPYIDPTTRIAEDALRLDQSLGYAEVAISRTCPMVGKFLTGMIDPQTPAHMSIVCQADDVERVRAIKAAFRVPDEHCTIRVDTDVPIHHYQLCIQQSTTDNERVAYALSFYHDVCPLATKLWFPPNHTVILVATAAQQADTWRFLTSYVDGAVLSNYVSVFVGSVTSAVLDAWPPTDDNDNVDYNAVPWAHVLYDDVNMIDNVQADRVYRAVMAVNVPTSTKLQRIFDRDWRDGVAGRVGFGHCVTLRGHQMVYAIFTVVVNDPAAFAITPSLFATPLAIVDNVVHL